MYSSGPARTTGAGSLRITRAGRRRYDRSSATAQDPRLPTYVSDMVRPYGLAYDNAPLAANLGQSFSEMCQPLIEEYVHEPVDLLVLAFDLHDLRPGQATAIYLGYVCPGDPLAFTVCDQGNAAPYTALRLIQTQARTGSVGRALLLVAEQATMHYELLSPAPLPQCHAATAFVLEPGPGCRSVVRPGIPPDRVLSELIETMPAADDLLLVAGAGLLASGRLSAEAGAPGGVEILPAPAGQPVTGAWWQLASLIDGDRPVVLADYEPRLGYLSCAWQEPALVAAV